MITTRVSTNAPRWAVTMFSFTNEMAEGSRDTFALLGDVLDSGLADAVEVDAAQHFPGFPTITRAEIARFRRIVDAHGAVPTMMGGYIDARLGPRGPRSEAEKADFLLPQIEAAAEMGFFAVRVGLGTMTPALCDAILPRLDMLGIQVLEEIQAGARPDAPAIGRTMELRGRLDTDRIGFVFDSSLVMQALPPTWVTALAADGVPAEVIDHVTEAWRDKDPDGWATTVDLIGTTDLPDSARRRLEMPFRRFGSSRMDEWSELLPHVTSVHLKFWDLDDHDGAVASQTTAVLSALDNVGYDGFVCSEWGGHDWLELEDHSGFAMTRRHRELVRTIARLEENVNDDTSSRLKDRD